MVNIELHNIDSELQRAVESGDPDFHAAYDAYLAKQVDLVKDVVSATLNMITAFPRDNPFGGYLAVDTSTRQVIGTCGFKTGPAPNGEVEIAYHTFPDYEGRGYATAMARQLVKMASASPHIHSIIAHTLPQEIASTNILRKLKFNFAGKVEDPEDGTVWRWEHLHRTIP